MDKQHFTPGDPVLIENIVNYLKAQGIFDEFRHECLADVDTKSSCQNLSQRVDGYTTKFLSNETWNPDLNKNELRNKLRRQIDESGMLAVGADHVVEQVINPKIGQLFLPRIIEVVYQYLKEETEKLNSKRAVAADDEKTSENFEGNSKAKTPIIDPIADILSFTYSKPKSSVSNIVQKSESAHKKSSDIALKTEKRKDDSTVLSKNTDLICKVEKKEEECTQSVKTTEIMIKNESKENVLQAKDIDNTENLEKDNNENVVKLESNESSNDNIHAINKTQNDPKDVKTKKEIKSDESEVQLDNQKKILKDISKLEKKKSEDVKPIEDSSLLCDANKSHNSTKSNSQNKNRHDPEKSKKLKVNCSQKTSSSDKGKTKSKDDKYLKSSSSKMSKSSSIKSDSSKSSKKDRIDESHLKVKTSDSQLNKPSDHSSKKSPKSLIKSSDKTELTSDKQAKMKSYKKQNTKPKKENQLSSTNTDKGNKHIHSSSSYESSQGSDQEKSHLTVEDSSKKLKHYSKHKESISSDKVADSKHSKESPDLKRVKKDSDNNISKKHKGEKHSISFQRKLKESKGLSHESAKISSRSSSFGSNSSISDSSKEVLPSSSEDVSENSSKQRESKKRAGEKEYCSIPQDFPPPPPPPPPSSDLPITESTTSSSPEDNTQSSQESDSESENGSDSDSVADSCSSNMQTSSQNSGIESDLFLYESSSSEFEGFSSPERNKERASVSDSVSSVHTSDLSSFEDDISIGDISDEDLPLTPDLKTKKKLPLKKAQEILDEKVHINSDIQKQICNEEPVSENASPEEEKLPVPISAPPLLNEKTSPPEPRRELRRERKLNPKYASNEYTSIFTSKRTSFITKQMNLSPQKQTLNLSSPNASSETTHKEDCLLKNVGYRETSQEECAVDTRMTEVDSEPKAELVHSKNFNCESLMDTESVLDEKVSPHKISKNNSPNRLTLNVKNSEIKANNTRKSLNSVKRKHEETEKTTNKRTCRRNSADSSSSKNGANENKPFNNEKLNKSANNVSISKRNLQKPKANGDILNKIEHLRKSSHTK